MKIRPAVTDDHDAIWDILRPIFRQGETYAIAQDIDKSAALDYWCGADRDCFVLDTGSIEGSFYLKANQQGGGAHVANAGFAVHASSSGKGFAEAMLSFAEDTARQKGFLAMQFNFVISTNSAAIKIWQRNDYVKLATLPYAFRHPTHGLVDAYVFHKFL